MLCATISLAVHCVMNRRLLIIPIHSFALSYLHRHVFYINFKVFYIMLLPFILALPPGYRFFFRLFLGGRGARGAPPR